MTLHARPAAAPASPEQERLLRVIRQMPPEALHALLGDLFRLVDEPRCAESQADGVPCTSAGGACERCLRFAAFLDDVREHLRAGVMR